MSDPDTPFDAPDEQLPMNPNNLEDNNSEQDSSVPDSYVPDSSIPDSSNSDSAIPDSAIPDFTNPETSHGAVILDIATTGKRFGNYILDIIFFIIFAYSMGILLGYSLIVIPKAFIVLNWFLTNGTLGTYVFGIGLMYLFFVMFEYFFNVTPGKIITRTKVVMDNGSKPTLPTIALRSLCRFIPFNAFSFLGSSYSGWHDKFSKTRVINTSGKRQIVAPSIFTICFVCIGIYGFIFHTVLPNSNANDLSARSVVASYHGVTFEYKDNWNIEKNAFSDSITYQITCANKNINTFESMNITFTKKALELPVVLDRTISSIRAQPVFSTAQYGDVTQITFRGNTALSIQYEAQVLSKNVFGQVIVFTKGDKTILYIKQAGSKENLSSKFSIIETTLIIE